MMEELPSSKDIHTSSWEFHQSHRNKVWVDDLRLYCCDVYLPVVVCLAHKAYRVRRRINWKESQQYLKPMTYISKSLCPLTSCCPAKSPLPWIVPSSDYHPSWSLDGKLKPRKLQLHFVNICVFFISPIGIQFSWSQDRCLPHLPLCLHTQKSAWHICWMIDSM